MYLSRELWRFTAGVRLRIAWTVLIGLAAVVAGIARLALLGWLLARVLAGPTLASLLPAVALVAAVTVVRGALEYWRTMIAHRTAARVQARLRETLYAQVTALGPAHFTRSRTGDVVLSMVEGIQQLEVYFGQYLPQLVVACLTPVLIFAFVAFIDLPVAAVTLVAAVATLLAPALWHRHESRHSLARSRAYAAYGAEFLDTLQGLPTLKAFGQSGARGRLLEDKGQALFESTMWVLGSNVLARGLADTAIAVGAVAALALGIYRVETGAIGLPSLLVILMLGVEVFRPLRELRVLLHQGMLGMSAAQGILAILRATPMVREAGEPARGARLTPSVAFDSVTFAYPGGRDAAHQGLTFSVAPGERIGFVGASGSGKSTIARLLLRFYDPQAGHVLVGGRDVRTLALDDLRAQIAIVQQDTYLFHGTVEDNLRLGKPAATPEELRAAARAANADEFIARLPQGYQTVVGERGVRLSGGQRQRIAIARALLRDAPILVLDEALSSVDAENEAVIQQALDRLMEGRTTLVFAHRLSSVVNADRILVLDAGRIVETGTHRELMARHGVYARLMAAQATDSAAVSDDALAAVEAPAAEAAPDRGDARPPERAPLGWLRAIPILMAMVRGYRARLSSTFLLGIGRVAALVGVGVLSALTVRAVGRGEPVGGLLVALAIVAPLSGLLHWFESWLAHDMAYRLLADLRLALFRKLDALAPAYLVSQRSGDLVSIATHDVELIEYFFAHTITPAFVAVLVPLVVLVTLGVTGWPMALAVLPFLTYAAVSPVLGRARIDRLAAHARGLSGELNAHAVDSIQGLTEIIAFQHVRARGAAFAALARAYLDARMPFLHDLTLQTALHEIVTGLGGLAVLTAGGVLVVQGRLDPAILPVMTLLAMSAFVPIWEIAQVGRQLADTLGATRRFHAIDTAPVAVQDGPGAVAAARAATPALELDDVTFVYPGRTQPALSGVSLVIPAGATVALVGPSGAGKTTIAHLFLRFWDPDKGTVRLDGGDLRAYRLDDLRQRVALVAQDTYLFNDTLRANVSLARPGASAAEVAAAVERAALTDFVASLPDGLDTIVGERGTRLSGGQRQRVAIARAFLKDAPILILDEATSHLDAVSEAAVRAALDRLKQDRTTLVIAHRLSTVRGADAIVVLDHGRVVEAGSHADLLARRGLYARLIAAQVTSALGATPGTPAGR
ncbi:MAG TPA: ABC transporter ATP-binding protein [Methylomirabilota bacterium]|nr:ABC transporter ATP-binding protein [Methylomirabilota bacterium]